MANPTDISITDLVANGVVTKPVGQVLDMNGDTYVRLNGRNFDRTIIEAVNLSDDAATLTLAESPESMGFKGTPLSVSLGAAGSPTDTRIIGPFASARFVQRKNWSVLNEGALRIILAGGSTPMVRLRAYRLPKAV